MQLEKIKIEGKEIALLGTAHVSKKSKEEVGEAIEKFKPDVVAVELDDKRYEILTSGEQWKDTRVSDIIKDGKAGMFLAGLVLSNYQRKIGEALGIRPGEEMLEGVRVAREKKIDFALIDRDLQVTFKRVMARMGLMERANVLMSLLLGFFEDEEITEDIIEELKEKDVFEQAISEISKVAPSVKKVLIDERDEYMAGALRDIKGEKILAIVGAGHLEGIKKNLKGSVQMSIKWLGEVPKRRSIVSYVGYLIPVIFAALIGYGFFTKGAGITLQMLAYWFLINGTLSAIGTAAAFGHPASILSAFLAAPLTSLNPAIAAGWVAGYVEAKVKCPKVRDFEGLRDIKGVKGYWKNQVTRILLVVVFANIGSVIGTFVALPYLVSLL